MYKITKYVKNIFSWCFLIKHNKPQLISQHQYINNFFFNTSANFGSNGQGQ